MIKIKGIQIKVFKQNLSTLNDQNQWDQNTNLIHTKCSK